MTHDDFQNKFLKIGYTKRKEGRTKSDKERPYIGRKGIGKLALLSCADQISIITKKKACQSWQPTRPREKERRLNNNENRQSRSPRGEKTILDVRGTKPKRHPCPLSKTFSRFYRLQSYSLLLSASTRLNLQLISLRSNRRQFFGRRQFSLKIQRVAGPIY